MYRVCISVYKYIFSSLKNELLFVLIYIFFYNINNASNLSCLAHFLLKSDFIFVPRTTHIHKNYLRSVRYEVQLMHKPLRMIYYIIVRLRTSYLINIT